MIATTNPDTNVDIYMGSGGAPEGVLAAAALRCVGGQFKGRLLFRNDDERRRAAKWGVEDLDRVFEPVAVLPKTERAEKALFDLEAAVNANPK